MARYVRIFTQLWHDEKVRTLSEDGRTLFFYILTSPHSTMLGLYVLPKPYMAYDLQWTEKRLAKPFRELLRNGLIKYDETLSVVLIPNYLIHNPIENENQAKAAAKKVTELPKSPLLQDLKRFVERLGKPFMEPLLEQIPKPVTVTVTETETETETEREGGAAPEPPPPKPQKLSYAENVTLTEAEYAKLVDKYSEEAVTWMIAKLDAFKGSKGKDYKSDYKAILSWVVEAWEERQRKVASGDRARVDPSDDLSAWEEIACRQQQRKEATGNG